MLPKLALETIVSQGEWPASLDCGIELFEGFGISFLRDRVIFGEGEPVEYLYKVASGMVRTHKILGDGRRQIAAFYMTGDVFGLELGPQHSLTAEAVVDARIITVKRSVLYALAAFDHDVAHFLWTITGRELHRARNHTLLLVKTAVERLASFLLEIGQQTQSSDEVELLMSRQDIADYLGLTIETVSRTFTRLENAAAIDVPSTRRIVVRSQAILEQLYA